MSGPEADFGILAVAADAPCAFWGLGGADPAPFAAATSEQELMAVVRTLPGNHSPLFAPVVTPTLSMGVEAFLTAVRTWLPAGTTA